MLSQFARGMVELENAKLEDTGSHGEATSLEERGVRLGNLGEQGLTCPRKPNNALNLRDHQQLSGACIAIVECDWVGLRVPKLEKEMDGEPTMRDRILERLERFGELKKTTRVAAGAFLLGCLLVGQALLTPGRTASSVAAAVQVVNTPLPVDTDNGARTPFAAEVIPDPALNPVGGNLSVPDGKDLVIEDVSAVCSLASNPRLMNLSAVLPQPPRNIGYDHFFILQLTGTSVGRGIYMASRTTRIYAAAGTKVSFEALLGSTTSSSDNCNFSISGYLTKPFS